ncbi:MAG: thioredoxin family protein [bacterium]|nr:thioredoxin family protein [bacterium]
MEIKILGSSACSSCNFLKSLVEEYVEKLSLEASVEKVESMQEILAYNVLSAPALVIDEKLIFQGRIPSRDILEETLLSFQRDKQ